MTRVRASLSKGRSIYEPTRVFAAIPSVISRVNIAPTTGLSATSSTRPLSSARSSAASNNRLPTKGMSLKFADGEHAREESTHRSC